MKSVPPGGSRWAVGMALMPSMVVGSSVSAQVLDASASTHRLPPGGTDFMCPNQPYDQTASAPIDNQVDTLAEAFVHSRAFKSKQSNATVSLQMRAKSLLK